LQFASRIRGGGLPVTQRPDSGAAEL